MKTGILFLLILLTLFSGRAVSQQRNGLFTAFDRFGTEYALEDLNIASARPLGGGSTVQAAPTLSCGSGYFIAYYAPGSIWDGNAGAQSVLCQVLSDISNFIGSPLSTNPNVGPKIRLYCSDTPTNAPNTLGAASAFYVFPGNPTNPNQGLLDNQIYKMIVSGIDSYSAVPSSFINGNTFYHGLVYANPSPPSGTWNTTLTNTSVAVAEFCMYTVLLHEMSHALGFTSLISANGTSVFGAANNFFSRYDKFLKDAAGNDLIGPQSGACPTSSLTFTASISSISPFNCLNTGTEADVTTCSVAARYAGTTYTVPLYTPGCFEPGASLCHFEDMCPISTTANCATSLNSTANNNKYYVMSNGQGMGTCYVKRYLKDEERSVLCDMGYSVSAVYGSTVAGSNFTYAAGACAGSNIWGINDGIVNGSCIYTAAISATNQIAVPIAGVLANDSPGTTTLSCLEVVYSNGFVSASLSGANIIITNGAGLAGPVVLKYLPKDAGSTLGGPTYIFAYFFSASCPSPDPCTLVQNGGFENTVGTATCGNMQNMVNNVACWSAGANYPTYNLRNCPGNGGTFNLGINTLPFSPPVDSYNGSPNNAVIGLGANFQGNGSGLYDVLESPLNGSLTPSQSYQVSLLAYNPSAVPAGYTVAPIVVSFNTIPTMGYLGVPTQFATFTVNPTGTWTSLTNTFVFTPTTGHSILLVHIDPSTASSNPNPLLGLGYQVFVDNLSIVSVPGPTFSIPTATNSCGNFTLTDLAQYASPVPGSFSGTGVSATTSTAGTEYSFSSSGLAAGYSYPVAFTYSTLGCSSILWQNIAVTQGINPGTCNDGYTLSAVGFTSGTTYTWLPGGSNAATVAVLPQSLTVYTLSSSSGSCQSTFTLALSPCCRAGSPPSFTSSVLSGTIAGPYTFSGSLTVPSGTTTLSGECVFAPGTSITVSSGGYLKLLGSHLYGCSSTMWNGIVVEDGGRILCGEHPVTDYYSMIEDAVTAIDVSNHTTSTLTSIVEARNTTFNRNYTAIKVLNYIRNSSSYPFSITRCVFSSRDFTFTSTAWPQASSTDLRSAISTTLLSTPYLLESAAIANLKLPYTSQPAQTAISMEGVGFTGSGNFYGLLAGSAGSGDFNLFDAHRTFIWALNSNLLCYNNVFQNTQYTVNVPGAGSAITHSAGAGMNTGLNMNPPNGFVTNRFIDCHRGVEGKNIYRFDMENAILQSSQSSTNTAFGPGNTGVVLSTNRFAYELRYNTFTNIANCINVPLAPGATTLVPPACSVCTGGYGIYGEHLAIVQNTFSPGGGSSGYLNQAVEISNPSFYPWTVAANSSSPPSTGIFVQDNSISNAYRGVSINGKTGNFISSVNGNAITLTDDTPFGQAQYGVRLLNSLGMNTIYGNDLQGVTSNTLTSLVYSALNTGITSPSITCNTLANSFGGFEFYSSSPMAVWAGNLMEPMDRGLALSYGGVMGAQGTTATAEANLWDGSWSALQTFVDAYSDAANSPLYVRSGSSSNPILNGGPFSAQTYSQVNNINLVSDDAGDYNCIGIPNNISVPLPDAGTYYDNAIYYVAENNLYRFLYLNDSIKNSDPALAAFYDNLAGSNPGYLMQVEEALALGNFSGAGTLLETLSDTNTVETNYKTYYGLYIAFGSNSFEPLTSTEEGQLAALAALCPGRNGACVYQARALYNRVFGQAPNPADDCDARGGERFAGAPAAKTVRNPDLYPNPTSHALTLTSGSASERLHVTISDLAGRLLMETDLTTQNFMATLELSLVNGAYIIILKTDQHATTVKKLLIAR